MQVVEDESAARRGLDAALQDDPWALLHPGRRVALDLDAARCGTGATGGSLPGAKVERRPDVVELGA